MVKLSEGIEELVKDVVVEEKLLFKSSTLKEELKRLEEQIARIRVRCHSRFPWNSEHDCVDILSKNVIRFLFQHYYLQNESERMSKWLLK